MKNQGEHLQDHTSVRHDRGETILELRQQNENLKNITVLVCSAENFARIFIHIEEIGANDFVAKPLGDGVLLHKLGLLL